MKTTRGYDLSLIVPALSVWVTTALILAKLSVTSIIITMSLLLIAATQIYNRGINNRGKHVKTPPQNLRLLVAATICLTALNSVNATSARNIFEQNEIPLKCLNPCALTVVTNRAAKPAHHNYRIEAHPLGNIQNTLTLIGKQLKNIKTNETLSIQVKYLESGSPPNLGTYKILQLKRRKSSIAAKISQQYATLKTNTAAAGLVIGMSISDVSSLKYQDLTAIRTAGAAHLIAISGLHLAILTNLLLRLLPGKRKNKTLATLSLLTLVVTAVGWQPSILRATSMAAVTAIAAVFNRHTQGLNTLALITTLWLIYNPWLAHNIGFLLSVTATATVLVVNLYHQNQPHWENETWTQKFHTTLKTTLILPVAAHLITSTITVIFFNQYAAYGIITNLLLTLLIPIITGFGVASLILSYPLTALGKLTFLPANTAAETALKLIHTIATWPFAELTDQAAWIMLITQWSIVTGFLTRRIMRCLKHGC